MSDRVTVTCPVCGTVFSYPKGQRGRPPIYCHEDCRNFFNLLGRLESYTERIMKRCPCDEDGQATEDGRKAMQRLRAQMWRIGNLFNYLGGMKSIRPQRSPAQKLAQKKARLERLATSIAREEAALAQQRLSIN